MGPTGGHIIMTGVNVWGIETTTMSGFGDTEYADRVNIVNTIKSWGANHVRFRLQASDYNAETYMTKAQYRLRIQQWHDLITAAGMYFVPVWWDSLDGPYGDTNWPAQYTQAFTMMTDVMNLFPNDPMVMYEPFNEPTGAVNDVQWVNAMKGTIAHFRAGGYTGILVIDPRVWAHCADDADFTTLEQYDAAQSGMNGTHQIVFGRHDYAREYSNPNAGFDQTEWPTNNGGCENWNPATHAVWESEFGNYSIDPSSVHLPWSQGAATYFRAKVVDSTLVGGSAFLFGPWLDANAMTTADNTTKTTWGGYVDDIFLAPYASPNGIGTLGSLIFHDQNHDGIYNAADGDTGVANATVAIYPKSDNTCAVSGGDTPLATTTTDGSGHYQFTLLPTDDGVALNGPGARYAVVVTDQNNVLSQYTHTTGTANTNDNSQGTPFCTDLTAATSDLQYADFGYGDVLGSTATPSPSAASGGLADTGQSQGLIIALALGLIGLPLALIGARTYKLRRRQQ
jgi:hypothetical protein